MRKSNSTGLAVVEWSPGGIRAWSPADRQVIEVAKISDLRGRIEGPVILALGRDAAFTKVIHLPEGSLDEVQQILRLQLHQHVPISGTDAACGLKRLGDRVSGGVPYLLAATKADTLRQIESELSENRMHAAVVTPTAAGSVGLAEGSAVVTESVRSQVGLDVVKDGSLALSRLLPPRADVAAEIQRSLALLGQKEMPIRNMGSDSSPLAALSGMDQHLSVELPEQAQRKASDETAKNRRMTLVFATLALASVAFVANERMMAAESSANADKKWAKTLANVNAEKKLIDTRLSSLNKINDTLKLGFEPAQHLSEALVVFSNLAPEGIWLTGVNLERGKKVQIRGTSTKADAITQYLKNLNEQKRFSDVKLLFANSAKIEEDEVVQFSMELHIVGNLPLDPEVLK